jgi:amino acid adenylation domain-containing protein
MDDLVSRIAALSPEKRALLENRLRDHRVAAPSGIARRSEDLDQVPLSFAQQRLWFLDRLEPNSSVYNVSASLRLPRAVPPGVLEEALRALANRHEVLRTTFPATDGEPRQRIERELRVRSEVVDLTGLASPAREAEAFQRCQAAKRRPFDLGRGPLLRALLLGLGDADSLVFLTFHHIVFDGWSIGILRAELTKLINAFSAGLPSPLEELPIQYADFAVWQREEMDGARRAKLLSYWLDRLQGAPPAIQLPFDRSRPGVGSFQGARRRFVLPPALTPAIQRLAKQEGATVFMTTLAAFGALMHLWSGEPDIVIGTPIANRTRPELEELIGFFANTLALLIEFTGTQTFRQLLAQVRETTLDALAHHDIPFELLVDRLHAERNVSHNPVFQVAFILESAHNASDLDELTPDYIHEQHTEDTAKFDLTLVLTEGDQRYTGYFEYSTDLFDPVTIDRLVERLGLVLDGVLAAPDRTLGEISVLTTNELDHLREVNKTSCNSARCERLMHQILVDAARRFPDNVAVEGPDRTLAYRELDDEANRLARHLRSLGVDTEAAVGVSLERGADSIVALFGVLKAGAAVLPLDPEYPPARLNYMLDRSKAPLVLTQISLADRFDGHRDRLLLLDDAGVRAAVAAQPRTPPTVEIARDQLAYIIFTSGSTGRPKGVLVTHSGIGPLTETAATTFGLNADSRVLQFCSPSFDVSMLEILMTLDVGATLVLALRAELVPGLDLVRLLRRRTVNTVFLSPSSLTSMPSDDLDEVGTVIVAGEAVSRELAQRWSPGRRLFNGYGPTEATILATIAECSADRLPPLGHPVLGYTVHVLDGDLRPVPHGRPGELYIGGIGLARGYLDQPDLTAQRFIPDPFSDRSGGRLYRTGDIVRWSADGELDFLGRTDHQVKLRGFRIELGEIETQLEEHRAVRNAVVVVRHDYDDPVLGAYFVPRVDEPAPAAAELRAFLRNRVPAYMVPAAFLVLAELPLTPNGKLDRARLAAPGGLRPYGDDGYVAPRDPIEQKVAEIWRAVLGIELVGSEDNFFDLGGNSLSGTRVIARINEAFGAALPVRTLFLNATVAGLARSVQRKPPSAP